MDSNRPEDDHVKPASAGPDQTGGPPYEKPALTNYGSLARLTRNTAGTSSDAKGTKRMV